MSREFVAGCVGDINDFVAYASTAPGATFSIVTTPAPSQGTYRWKATGDGTVDLVNGQGHAPGFTKTWRFLVQRDFRVSGTLTAGQKIAFLAYGSNDLLRVSRVSDSTWNIELYDFVTSSVVATGTTALNTDQDYNIRVVTNGSVVKVLVGSTEEINVSQTCTMQAGIQIRNGFTSHGGGLATGQSMLWGVATMWEGDAESDRPGTACNKYMLPVNVNASSALFGNQTVCLGGGEGSYAEWDDWNAGGTADDATTYNCARGGDGGVETSETDTVTVAFQDSAGVSVVVRVRAAVGSKTINSYMRIGDGTYSAEVQNANIASAIFILRAAAFAVAPDTGAWDQTDIGNLRAGVRTVNTNNDTSHWTALGVQVWTIDSDPPATTFIPQVSIV